MKTVSKRIYLWCLLLLVFVQLSLSGIVAQLLLNASFLEAIARMDFVDHQIKVVGQPLKEIKSSPDVRDGNTELINRLNLKIESLFRTPLYRGIYVKWYSKPQPFWTAGRIFWAMLSVLMLTVLVLLVWRYFSLRPVYHLKQAQADLRESESLYRGIVEDQTELICRFLPDGTLTFVNGAYCRYFEKTPADLIGQSFIPLIPLEDRMVVMRNIASLSPEQPLITYKHRIISPTGEIRYAQWTNRAIIDNEGNIIEFQAVGRDITDIKQVEQELENRVQQRAAQLEREIRERVEIEQALKQTQTTYKRLVESIPGLIYQFSTRRGGIFYSAHVVSVLGYELEDLYANPWLWQNSIHPDDLVNINKVIAEFIEGKDFSLEYRIRDKKGNWHWLYDCSIGRIEENDDIIVEGVALDITEYKQAQMALNQAYQQLTFHVENTPLAVIEWDSQYHVKRWSPQAEKIFGWTEAEIIGKSCAEFPFVFEEDMEKVTQYINAIVSEKKAQSFSCNRNYTKNGSVLDCQWYNSLFFDELGQVVSGLSLVLDVSEQQAALRELRRTEAALKDSEERLQLALVCSGDSIWEWDLVNGKLLGEKKWLQMIGYDDEDIETNLDWWCNLVGQENVDIFQTAWDNYRSGKAEYLEFEYTMPKKSGEYIRVGVRGQCIAYDQQGNPLKIVGTHRDITQRRQIEQELSKQRELLQSIVDNIPIMLDLFDSSGQCQWVNREWERVLNGKAQGINNREMLAQLYPDSDYLAYVINFIQMAQGIWEDFKTRLPDGTILDTSWANVKLSDGSIIGIGQDITERKRIEQELIRQRELLQTIVDNIPIMLTLFNSNGQYQWINREWEKVLGWPLEEMKTKDILAQFYPDPAVLALVVKFIEEAKGTWADFKTRLHDGTILDTSWANVKLSDGSTIGIGQDITERKRIEEALSESQRQLSTLISNISGAIYRCHNDDDWSLNFASEGILELTGYSAADFVEHLNVTWFQLIHPEDAQKAFNDVQIALQDKKPFETVYRIVTATGTEKWVLDKGIGKFSQQGELEIIEGLVIDITEQKQIEQALEQSEQNYRLLFDANPNPLWVYDLETLAFLEVNQAAIRHYGYSREQFLTMTLRDIYPSEDVPTLEKCIAKIGPSVQCSVQWRHLKHDGEIIDVEVIAHSLTFGGRPARLVLANDITERLKTENALQESEDRFRRAMMDAPFPIIIHAEDGEVISINHTWTELTGYTHEDIPMIANWLELAYGERQESVSPIIDRLYHIEHKVKNGEFAISTKNGQTRIWDFSSAPLGQLPDGRKLVISTATDVTERKEAEEKLRYAALHDALTDLPNRTLLMERINQAIKQAQEQEDYLFAVMFIDLDRFKVVNDSLGHLVGDRLLQAIAVKLKKCVRPTDTVARFGGDEFVILLQNLKTWKEATKVAERISEDIQASLNLQGQQFYTSASIGIAFYSHGDQDASDLLRNADIAMYRAKERGKARYAIFDPVMHTHITNVLELETNLRQALDSKQFLVYYQPIVSLATRNLVGFEALVRWLHPEKGLIPPVKFIPIAEETGLIVPLGQWVLSESCRQMKAWQEQFPNAKDLRVSVNLSGRQLQQHDFIEQIDQVLAQTGIDGKNLKLEITESMLMSNKESITDLLLQIRERKIQISIDDFGTGYSSLSYLHFLPVNTLKIDRSFVTRMNEMGENFEIVEAIITLAHHLEMNVVAEGVETERHLEQLRMLGCEYGQGYFFAKPLDSNAVVNWLERL